ncbi:MAG: hypothetical protein R2991_07360 [Thermoanaerobaculia bacterium]
MRTTPVWGATCLAVVLAAAPAHAEPIEIQLTGLLLLKSGPSDLDVYVPKADGHHLKIFYDCDVDPATNGTASCTEWQPPPGPVDLSTLSLTAGAPTLDLHDPLRIAQLDASCQLDGAAQPRFSLPHNPVSAQSGPIEYSTAYGERNLAEVYLYAGVATKPTLNGKPLTPKAGAYRLLITNTSSAFSPTANRIVLAHMMELADETLTCEPTWITIPVSTCCVQGSASCSECALSEELRKARFAAPVPEGSGPVRCPPVWGG